VKFENKAMLALGLLLTLGGSIVDSKEYNRNELE